MDILQINELTDEMMSLSNEQFYQFLDNYLGKDLCELFRIQAIRDMSSLSGLSLSDLIEVFNCDIVDLISLKAKLGFVSTDGRYHLRLGYTYLIERLLLLATLKKDSTQRNEDILDDTKKDDILERLVDFWVEKQKPFKSIRNAYPSTIDSEYFFKPEQDEEQIQLWYCGATIRIVFVHSWWEKLLWVSTAESTWGFPSFVESWNQSSDRKKCRWLKVNFDSS